MVDRYEPPNKDDVARVYHISCGPRGQDVRVAVFSVQKKKEKTVYDSDFSVMWPDDETLQNKK